MNKPKKASGIFVGTVALTLLVAVSAPHIGQEPITQPHVRPVSVITHEHRVLPPPKPAPTPAGKETTNVKPDSTPPTGIAFEPQKPNAATEILTTNEPLRDNLTPEPIPPQITVNVTPAEPKMGDIRTVDGQKQVYFLGFGWIEDNDEPNIGIVVDGDGDINKMVGSMGGGEIGRSCGDINKMVGTMN